MLIHEPCIGLVCLPLTLLQARLGGLDDFKPVGSALQLLRQSPIITVRTLLSLFGPVLRFGLLQQSGNLCLKPRLFILHPAITPRLMLAGIGLDLRAIDTQSPKLHQSGLPRQLHHLHEQRRELLQVQLAKLPDRAVRWKVVRTEYSKGNVLSQLAGDLARGKYAARITVDQHLDHHPRIKGLASASIAFVASVKRL